MDKNRKSKRKNDKTFLKFLNTEEQKNHLLLITSFYLIGYFVLMYAYPYPDGISDSGGYIASAIQNQYLGYRPVGYSVFLRKLHAVSTSISFVVFVQYWLNAACTVFFIFTIKYFFKPKNRIIEYIFEWITICSVSSLYLTNSILSDPLFSGLTTLWIAVGCWFIFVPQTLHKTMLFLLQAVLLGMLCSIRYTSLFYVVISVVTVFVTFFRKDKLKALGFSVIPVILLAITYFNQIKVTKELTGVKSFSAFSGWQMANNALHVIPHIQLDSTEITDRKIRNFCQFVKQHDTLIKIPENATTAAFMWAANLPLKQYLQAQINRKGTGYLTEYTYLGEFVYSKFGAHIMKEYPMAYLRYFIIPNMLGVVYPKHDDLFKEYKPNAIPSDLLLKWFEINPEVKFYSRSRIVARISKLLPEYKLILGIIMLVCIGYIVMQRSKIKWDPVQNNIYWIIVFFVCSYIAFHIYAAPFTLRYSIPIHPMQMTIVYLALNYMNNTSELSVKLAQR